MRQIHALSLNSLYRCFSEGQASEHARQFCRLLRLRNVDVLEGVRTHVLGDDWQDFAYISLREHFSRAKGTVYVVASAARPELVKVGKTRSPMHERLRALNNEAVLDPYDVAGTLAVHDRHWVELRAHQVLKQAGVHQGKEFFNAPAEDVLKLIESLAAQDAALFERQGLYDLLGA